VTDGAGLGSASGAWQTYRPPSVPSPSVSARPRAGTKAAATADPWRYAASAAAPRTSRTRSVVAAICSCDRGSCARDRVIAVKMPATSHTGNSRRMGLLAWCRGDTAGPQQLAYRSSEGCCRSTRLSHNGLQRRHEGAWRDAGGRCQRSRGRRRQARCAAPRAWCEALAGAVPRTALGALHSGRCGHPSRRRAARGPACEQQFARRIRPAGEVHRGTTGDWPRRRGPLPASTAVSQTV
jgi:hypothetical protein